MFHELRRHLLNLKEIHSLAKIKAGTEVEAMTFDEIRQMRQISHNIVPMVVKIGGPEARNDIAFMMSLGVNMILAPMVESVYGLKNFIETMAAMDKKGTLLLAINIETITAYENLEKMCQLPHFNRLNQVTVGRSDFSGSLEKDADDPYVFELVARITKTAHQYGKNVSIGGKVTPVNCQKIKDVINPDFINTRHMVISCHSSNLAQDIHAALEWEENFYSYLQDLYPMRNEFYIKRMITTRERSYLRGIA
ncbi:MAG: hypothetical protein JW969_15910 [Spirochaetales bacterium]|nr:hypothetical protein [Spirochaetales bacterium]